MALDLESNPRQELDNYLVGMGIRTRYRNILTDFFSDGGKGLMYSEDGEQKSEFGQREQKLALIRLGKFLKSIRGKTILEMVDEDFNRHYNGASDCSVDFPAETRLKYLEEVLLNAFKYKIDGARSLHGLLRDAEESLFAMEEHQKKVTSKIQKRMDMIKTLKSAHTSAKKRIKRLEKVWLEFQDLY